MRRKSLKKAMSIAKNGENKELTKEMIQDINEKYKKVVENTEKIAAEQKVLVDELKGGSVDVTL